MSYDVFFQGFIAGEIVSRGSAEMLRVLAPHTTTRRGSFVHIEVGDGEADLYLNDDGMMANHITGTDPWDLLVKGAEAANWVIVRGHEKVPTGGQVEVPTGGQIEVPTLRVVS